jgi:hypothetical protein
MQHCQSELTVITIYDLLNEAMRDRFGGSVTRLSDACSVSVALGSRWLHEDERKRIVPSPGSCEKIASGLGLDPDYVLEAAGHRHPQTVREGLNPRLAAFLAQVEAAFHTMTDQEWSVREEAGRALFSVPPTSRATKRRQDDEAKRARAALHGMDTDHASNEEEGPSSMLRAWSHSLFTALRRALAGCTGPIVARAAI